MVHAVGVLPPVGTVMVLAPEERVLISTLPGLAALAAAVIVSTPVTSPVKVMMVDLVDAAAICYNQKSPVCSPSGRSSFFGSSIFLSCMMSYCIFSGSLLMSRLTSAVAGDGKIGHVMSA